MAKYKDTDLAYIAGLLDGEGTISIAAGSKKWPALRVEIASTDYEVLHYAEQVLGVGKIHSQGQFHPLGGRPCFKYYIYCQKASDVLGLVLPYLHIKKQQAILGIKWQKNIVGRKQPGEVRKYYIDQMRALNHKWRLL